MSLKKDIGKTIYSSDGKVKGVVTSITNRWCAGCQSFGPVYSVKWEDGKRTYPCPAGCRYDPDGAIQIG